MSDKRELFTANSTYGLLKSIRSHTIASPTARETAELNRPNACNLCHLDKSLQWTAKHLTEWYQQPPVERQDADADLATGVLWSLKGDAGLRALTARSSLLSHSIPSRDVA